MLCTIFK